MASKYWIKLYHEILHDPKMGQLPDRLWRRVIELFLLAGEFDQEGELPTIKEMCWTLRITEEECNETLHELQRLDVAHCNGDAIWVITHFADRQAANTSTERSRAHRERKRQENQLKHLRNEPEKVQRNVAPDTDKDTDKESSPNGGGTDSKKLKKGKDSVPIPDAVKVYQTIARRLPDKVLWPEIEVKVGVAPECLDRWGKVITAYIGCGWNKLNLSGMLRFYEENRIPSTEPIKNGGSNGATILERGKKEATGLNPTSAALGAALLARARTGSGGT